MAAKSSQLQVRISAPQKRRLRRLAAVAGQDLSSYVLGRVFPDEAGEFAAMVGRLAGATDVSFPLAELHDFLDALTPADFGVATESAEVARLSAFAANYLAAMVEHVAAAKAVPPPAWAGDVPPLDVPYFATPLKRLRLHLLRAAPAAFKRRNLFVDSVVGSRV